MGFLKMLSDLVFPGNIYCICCGSIIDKSMTYSLCSTCMENIHWNTGRKCRKCGKAIYDACRGGLCYDCMENEHIFDKGISCTDYGLYERSILMDFKYGNKPYIGRKLAEIYADRIACEDLKYDIIVPVPIHDERMMERGYNQAEIITKVLAKICNVEYNGNALKRTGKTVAMRSLSPFERRENLKGAFEVLSAERKAIEGKNILLIDDIYTTGATADECAAVLKEAGSNEVYIFSFASAPNKRVSDE